MEYVQARHDWERRAVKASNVPLSPFQPSMQPDPLVEQEIRSDLRAIRERYLTPRALATNTTVSFGTEPEFNPDGLTVLRVEERDRRRVRVTTAEFPHGSQQYGLPAFEFEYALVLVEGRWRLNSRTTKDRDGHTIRGLL